jgi:hypothetical protein
MATLIMMISIIPSEYIYELMNIEYTCHLLPHGSLPHLRNMEPKYVHAET